MSNHPRVTLIRHVKSLLQNILRRLESQCLSEDDFDWMQFQVDRAYYLMIRGTHLYDIQTSLLICLEEARRLIEELVNADAYYGYVPGKTFSGNRGRPKINITKEQLEFMLEYKFTVPQISKMLNVSTSTIARRLHDYGLSTSTLYARINDQELDGIIREISAENVNCGYKRMQGFLVARGLHVQQRRVRCSMRRIDPEGVLARTLQLNTVARRQYHVPSPLSLWHIDGNHKLIRYSKLKQLCLKTFTAFYAISLHNQDASSTNKPCSQGFCYDHRSNLNKGHGKKLNAS